MQPYFVRTDFPSGRGNSAGIVRIVVLLLVFAVALSVLVVRVRLCVSAAEGSAPILTVRQRQCYRPARLRLPSLPVQR
jgi:hypothetical protein